TMWSVSYSLPSSATPSAVELSFSLIYIVSSFHFFVEGRGAHQVLPSFPTRRSSDLGEVVIRFIDRHGHTLLQERLVVSGPPGVRSEEHTSELQSRENLVCRLLLEKKKL